MKSCPSFLGKQRSPIHQEMENVCCLCSKEIKENFDLYRVDRKIYDICFKYGERVLTIGSEICRKCKRKVLGLSKYLSDFKRFCCNCKTCEKSVDSPSCKIFLMNKSSIPILRRETPGDTDHLSSDTVDVKSVSVKRKLNFESDHAYNKDNDSKLQKVSKKTSEELVLPLTFHDHTYGKYDHCNSKIRFKQHSCAVKKVIGLLRQCASPEEETRLLTVEEKKLLVSSTTTGDVAEYIQSCSGAERILSNKQAAKLKNVCLEFNNRKKGFVSVLMKKDYLSMKDLDWDEVLIEFLDKFPCLATLLISIMIPAGSTPDFIRERIPRVAFVYAVILQCRNAELSRAQRVITMTLFDSIADQKIFDRLQPLGVCLSYNTSMKVLDQIGQGYFNNQVLKAVKSNSHLRIIGDNVNFSTTIRNQHMSDEGRTKIMHHAFGSALLFNDFSQFASLPSISPQCDWMNLRVEDFIIDVTEKAEMKKSYAVMIAKVAAKFIPALDFVEDVMPENTQTIYRDHKKTQVIPLELLEKNEQYYDQVVDILDFYEEVVEKTFGDLTDDLQVHIGGDQLTRERFSGAKCLRAGALDPKERLQHLSPITFEFFHLLMNFLMVFCKQLYKQDSGKDTGTMKAEIDRIMRTNFDEDVRKAYDADKDFVLSYVDAYIVELARNFFGLEDIYGNIQKNVPPDFQSTEEKMEWVFKTFQRMYDEMLGANTDQEANVIEEGQFLTIKRADGENIQVKLVRRKVVPVTRPDRVNKYAKLVLELGFIYKELVDLCHMPSRAKAIRIVKQCMLVFKGNSNCSKYALECHRFLVQQKCILSVKKATETFYAMFVNTKGLHNTYIPADLQMEFIVKLIKKHIKHMYSNKHQSNIQKRTRGLSCLQTICEQFDFSTSVVKRAKQHNNKGYKDDELVMVNDLKGLNPFKVQPGRHHDSFPSISGSFTEIINIERYREWINEKIIVHATELGQ